MVAKIDTRLRNDSLRIQIIKELYFNRFLSCADLSVLTNKSVPVIAKILKELTDEHFVVEQGFGTSSGGRRPLMYSLRPNEKLILSVAMDQRSTQITIYDLMHNQLADVKVYDLDLANNRDSLQILIRSIKDYIKESAFSAKNILAVGISMPGFVDLKKGINYTFLDAGGQNLRKYIGDQIDLPVYIDNDSCLIALAELRFGLAKSRYNAMVVNVAWGIGLGMILNGQMFRGHTGFAGEFSHIPTSLDGRLCSCGKRGCLETDASLLVVAEKALEGIQNGRISSLQQEYKSTSLMTADIVMEAANKGDQFAIELLADAGNALGKGLAVLIHIINPEVIILSGRGARAGKIFSASIQQALHKYAIPRLAESTELLISELGSKAGLIGAAALVMEHFGEYSTTSKQETKENHKYLITNKPLTIN